MANSKYALISVYDKKGILEFAKALEKLDYQIISSGGTARVLKEANVKAIPIQDITGNKESFDGRIKTLSFEIEGGILFDKRNPQHIRQAQSLKIPQIEIVVCNFYPFLDEPSIENIDVGGPTMLRAAAKNFKQVLPVCDPDDYGWISKKLESDQIDSKTREQLAQKAFEYLSFYDSQIATFFRRKTGKIFPTKLSVPIEKVLKLRYGDNPHQQAALYLRPSVEYSPFKNLKKISGRDLSSINITDINAGLESIRLFDTPAAVVIKHNGPCGIALGDSISQAFRRAIIADPESAFGGVVVLNRPLNKRSVNVINSFKQEYKGQFDILAVPEIEKNALNPVKTIRKSMGIYIFGKVQKPTSLDMSYKEVIGGFVRQTPDWDVDNNYDKWEVVTKVKPSQDQLKQMKLVWKMIRRIRSNAVIVVDKKLPMTRGIGTGQTSRFRATKLALELATRRYTKGAILASDAFFPFPDSVSWAAKYNIGAIVQPGGSIQDQASIDAANKAGIPMVFTHERVFWHY